MFRLLLFLLLYLISMNIVAQSKPKAFLPEIFENYPNVRDIAISPDGNEIYFTVDDLKSRIAVIAYITKNKDGWSEPKTVSFTGNYRDLEPAFSYEGDRLYFVSNRPVESTSITPKDYDIWYVDKTEIGWSKAKNIGSPVNTEGHEFYPSVTKKGDLYFTTERVNAVGREDIFVSRLEDGIYQEPIPINGGVNTKYFEFNAFVAPDESYLIFSAQRPKEGLGGSDLYISYKKDNSWGKAKLIENINSPYLDFCPFVDLKTNRLYFTSQKTDIKKYYEESLALSEFLKLYSSGTPMGLNRLYYIDFSKITLDKN